MNRTGGSVQDEMLVLEIFAYMDSQHTYHSALGWFELGNYVEAFNKLENLSHGHRASVEASELRCRI